VSMVQVHLDGDQCWPDLPEKTVVHLGNGAPPIQVGVLRAGTSNGHPSVTIRCDLPDGSVVLAETSARLFCLAGRMIMEKYPHLFDGA
jgi:hypothetical protein